MTRIWGNWRKRHANKIAHFKRVKGKAWVDAKLNGFKNMIRRKILYKLGIKGRYLEEESQEVAEDQPEDSYLRRVIIRSSRDEDSELAEEEPEDSYRSRSGKWLRRRRRRARRRRLAKLRKFRRVLHTLWA